MSWAAAPATRRFDGTPAAPALLLTAVVNKGAAVRGWVGGPNEISRSCLTEYGLGAEAPSQGPPDPRRAAATKKEEHRLTTRPRREPGRTGPSRAEVSPPPLEWPRAGERMSIGTGRGPVPGTAAWPCGAGPPESA